MTASLPFHTDRVRLCLRWAFVWAFSAVAALAQKPASSEQLKSPVGLTETGVLDGAAYRIDVPVDWNRKLVVYYHGYAQQPVTFHLAEKLTGQQAPLFERHYAVIQSGYSQPGWALPQAYPETESLRRYFVKKFGQPTESYVAGGSMGGALVMVTLELNPKPYLGGLDLCGAVGPTFESFERRFAMRAAFDSYFPGLMGNLVPVASDYMPTEALREKILAALKANPQAATEMRALMGVHTDPQVAWDIAYFTFVIGDMQRRAGGNPFDNRNYIYTGTNPDKSTSDFALNDAVKRYAALPKAQEYLMRHYYPSGRLERPMLAVHTVNDPLVPAGSLALYDHMVKAAGFGENLAQQYVKHDGHCNITPEEEGRAFDELVEWTHHGPRPVPGAVPVLEKKVPPVIVKEPSH
jgi:pimeloyl-ACP methyl ester carboxylesterase